MYRAENEWAETAAIGWHTGNDRRFHGPMLLRLEAWLEHIDTHSVEQISQCLDISQARLLRLCRASFGHAPKYLLRRSRFVRMLRILQTRPYSEWRDFLDPRYVDQSHFIRDFHFFAGMAPRDYLGLTAQYRSQIIDFIEDKLPDQQAA